MLPAIAIAAMVGAVLLMVGLIGRKVSDHPHCTRCGFDLDGAYPDAERCPECGGKLTPDHDFGKPVIIGKREKRRLFLVPGAMILLLAVGVLVVTKVMPVAGMNLDRYKPTWMLQAEMQSADSPRAEEIGDEIIARIRTAGFKKHNAKAIADRILAYQRTDLFWHEDAARIFDELARNVLIDDDTIMTYFENWLKGREESFPLAPRVRPGVLPGGNWRTLSDFRSGLASFTWIRTLVAIELDGEPIELPIATILSSGGRSWYDIGVADYNGPQFSTSSYSGPLMGEIDVFGWPRDFDAPAGKHTLTFRFRYWILDETRADPVIGTFTRDFSGEFEVVPHAEPIVDLIKPTPELEQQFRRAMSPRLRVMGASWDMPYAELNGSCMNLGVPLVADVLWRDEHGNEGALGTLRLVSRYEQEFDFRFVRWMMNHTVAPAPPEGVEYVTLVFTPNPEAAPGYPPADEIYGGELTVENVPVDR